MIKIITSFIMAGVLFGCASTAVFDISQVDRALTPGSVIAQPEYSRGKTVLWGGTILHMQNLKDSTQIEILAYPLNKSNRPLHDKTPQGRFIILHPGFLEPTVYVQGQMLSVLGKVADSQQGKVGNSDYTYPVVTAEKLQLWSPRDNSVKSSFHFGIGISF